MPVIPPAPIFKLSGIASSSESGVAVLTAIVIDNGAMVFVKAGDKLSNGYSVVRDRRDVSDARRCFGCDADVAFAVEARLQTRLQAGLKSRLYTLTSQAFLTAFSARISFITSSPILFVRRFVDVHGGDRAGFASAQGEVGDVDVVLAEDRADLADHARLIVVHEQDRRARAAALRAARR